MFHKKSSLIITFSSSLDEGFGNESFGIRDFEIFICIILFYKDDSQVCGNGV